MSTRARSKRNVSTFRVEQDGETVWSGEGDSYKVIPEELRARPENTPPGEPHPPARFLYAVSADGNEELIGVQISQDEEDELVETARREQEGS